MTELITYQPLAQLLGQGCIAGVMGLIVLLFAAYVGARLTK